MRQTVRSVALRGLFAATLSVSFGCMVASVLAQSNPDSASPPQNAGPKSQNVGPSQFMSNNEALLKTPLSHNQPGGIAEVPKINHPNLDKPGAIERGMRYFTKFNCVGCHAPNGGGGIGPALSRRYFKYGSSPADLYLVIEHGAPLGMPAWGSVLPSDVVWDIVAYIEQLRKAPVKEWGTTISAASPSIQQVPAEFKKTDHPWAYVEPFSKGQKPTGKYSGHLTYSGK